MLKKSTQLTLATFRFTPAHLAVQEAICSWCGAPVEVHREPAPHLTVPCCESCREMLRGGKPDETP